MKAHCSVTGKPIKDLSERSKALQDVVNYHSID